MDAEQSAFLRGFHRKKKEQKRKERVSKEREKKKEENKKEKKRRKQKMEKKKKKKALILELELIFVPVISENWNLPEIMLALLLPKPGYQ